MKELGDIAKNTKNDAILALIVMGLIVFIALRLYIVMKRNSESHELAQYKAFSEQSMKFFEQLSKQTCESNDRAAKQTQLYIEQQQKDRKFSEEQNARHIEQLHLLTNSVVEALRENTAADVHHTLSLDLIEKNCQSCKSEQNGTTKEAVLAIKEVVSLITNGNKEVVTSINHMMSMFSQIYLLFQERGFLSIEQIEERENE